MITKAIGTAMAVATTRHNNSKTQKLVVFYKALEIVESSSNEEWESKVVFAGTLGGKQAEVSLLNTDGKITLNLAIEGKNLQPLTMTSVINENDYLTWNLQVREEMNNPQAETPVAPKSDKIVNAKSVNQKAKTHDVHPVDRNTFHVKSSSSENTYLVRLMDSGATCDCKWGQTRKYSDNYRSGCSHVQAVYQQLEEQRSRTTSAWTSKKDAQRQHRQMAELGDGVILTLRKM